MDSLHGFAIMDLAALLLNNPHHMALRTLSRVAQRVGGREFPPKHSAVEALLRQIRDPPAMWRSAVGDDSVSSRQYSGGGEQAVMAPRLLRCHILGSCLLSPWSKDGRRVLLTKESAPAHESAMCVLKGGGWYRCRLLWFLASAPHVDVLSLLVVHPLM